MVKGHKIASKIRQVVGMISYDGTRVAAGYPLTRQISVNIGQMVGTVISSEGRVMQNRQNDGGELSKTKDQAGGGSLKKVLPMA